MDGTKRMAYSRLSRVLIARRFTVADLCKRLSERGVSFDRKTVYRLAGFTPMQTINAPVLGAICEELNINIGDVIAWEPSKPELHRIDGMTQQRLSLLMEKNNEGCLTDSEAAELAELGDHAEKLSLENARILAEAAAAVKRRRETSHMGNLASKNGRKSRQKVRG